MTLRSTSSYFIISLVSLYLQLHYSAHAEKYEEKIKTRETTCDKLNTSNSSFGEAFDLEAIKANRVFSKFDDLKDVLEDEKAKNKELKDHVNEIQEKYMDTAQCRLEMQRTMAKILNLIQDNGKDPDIIEEVVVIALTCESDCKAEMAALEVETAITDVEFSDDSDSTGLNCAD